MEKRRIGNTELETSVVGFGCWTASGGKFWTDGRDDDSINAIKTAMECGVNFFDVAPVYGFGHAEEILGEALKGNRDKVIIASKCGLVWDENYQNKNLLSKKSILKEIDDSLRRLGTDYIDLYQLHWPDSNTPIEETMEAMNMVKASGKIRYIGISNFPVNLANKAMKYSSVVSQQCLYNMFDRNEEFYHGIPLNYHTEEEILPYCKEHKMAFLPYSPLCQGLLAGSISENRMFSESDVRLSNPSLKGENLRKRLKIVEKLNHIAKNINKPLNQLAINWLINNPVITSIICGAKNSNQAEKNSLSSTWKLDADTMAEINTALNLL